jgi:NADH-quinone oxidoreductase subunit L
MTFPLLALAVGAMVAGFVGVPSALGGSNAIEHFLEPSFTAQTARLSAAAASVRGVQLQTVSDATGGVEAAADRRVRLQPEREIGADAPVEEPHVSRGFEIGLMIFSVLIAAVAMLLAYKFYVTSPQISEELAHRWSGAHRLLSNKYYVDELYDATAIAGTFASARGLWSVDRHVVDGAVNGTGWLTVVSAWLSGLTDRAVVDGLVNFIGRFIEEGSFWFRRFQTGLVQTYALLMLFGIFVFVSIYLLVR